MEFVDRNKKSCSEPHRIHGSLIFRDSEPIKEGDKRHDDESLKKRRKEILIRFLSLSLFFFCFFFYRFPHGSQVTFHCVSADVKRDKTTWQIVCLDGSWNGRPLSCGKLEIPFPSLPLYSPAKLKCMANPFLDPCR